jgi:hypothetical protein
MLLAGAERQKGMPLNEQEVLRIRDDAQSITMTESQADRFYASLDSQCPVPRINPERVWEEWQAIRPHLQ